MQECMNCGGPVADDESHCTTCGLPRGAVIYGERQWSAEDSRAGSDPSCALCGGPLDRERDDDDVIDEDDDENDDICLTCEADLQQPPEL
jgi:hypothetical protein